MPRSSESCSSTPRASNASRLPSPYGALGAACGRRYEIVSCHLTPALVARWKRRFVEGRSTRPLPGIAVQYKDGDRRRVGPGFASLAASFPAASGPRREHAQRAPEALPGYAVGRKPSHRASRSTSLLLSRSLSLADSSPTTSSPTHQCSGASPPHASSTTRSSSSRHSRVDQSKGAPGCTSCTR